MLVAAFAAMLVLTCLPAAADRGHGGGHDNGGVSAQQAAAIVSRAYGGRVVSVKSQVSNGEPFYKVRVLLDGGRVKTVTVDSRGHLRD